MNNFKVVFLGLNNETLVLLTKSKSLDVIGVNFFEYFYSFSFNPVDQLFKIVYKLHFKKKYRFISLGVLKIWNKLHFLSNSLYKNNKEYLNIILRHNIEVIDTEDIEYVDYFFKKNEIDLLVINSWGIVPDKIINLPKYKTLNIHPSILPQYRGALPTLWSLKNKDEHSALTYIILNEFIDDGLIINQHIFSIESNDDWYSLEKKIASILEKTLVFDILNYLNGNYVPLKTNKEVSFTGYYNKYRVIDFQNETSSDIYNKVGLYPYIEPFFYCFFNILSKKIYVKKVHFCKNNIKIRNKIKSSNITIGLGIVFMYTKDGILKSYLFKDISFFDSMFLLLYKIINKI
ncbi:MAG: methionyl-tRNA formyltransferase [Patescibacteria group bacterium]|nr:methionyl-tRNA formyltransferase [Patescibacteria group bacterium]